MNQQRWRDLMDALDFTPSIDTFRNLEAAYAEPHRYYHTGAHIEHCLAMLDDAADLAEDPIALETAIWFHDAVYNPKAKDNELKSAAWARQFLEHGGADAGQVDLIQAHIMATEHHEKAGQRDSCLMVDIDLTILGSAPETYEMFEVAVRKEYEWVPYFIYRRKRSALLASFLDRDVIYTSRFFHNRFEEKARANIAAALKVL